MYEIEALIEVLATQGIASKEEIKKVRNKKPFAVAWFNHPSFFRTPFLVKIGLKIL